MIRGKKTIQYIFFEMLPSFLMGLLVFVLIILMFQVLRLTDFALVHGVELTTIAEIVGYICISMLPALFPMSLLFAIIMTYSRLSNDSEVVAMKASGLHMGVILSPAVLISILIAIISAQTSFEIAPWGNRQFEVLYSKIGNTKAAANIKSGVFSEGFFDMVVYANQVDSELGILTDVFIYDERDIQNPLTIIAKEGQIIHDPIEKGQKAFLRLTEGNIHRKTQTHTKIKFDSYDLKLSDPIQNEERKKSPQSLTLKEIQQGLASSKKNEDERRTLLSEFHKRWAISVLCIVFALIGVGLGTNTNRRNPKAGGIILCIGLIIVYWIIYIIFEGMARNGQAPVALAIWAPNFIFSLIGLESLRRNWN